jgi:pSer/pThr/pTyr-binding forkhead associated (FHA) protein
MTPPAFRLKLIGDGFPAASDEDAGEIGLRTVAGRIDLLLGRHAADILLDHPTVSRRHARLTGSADTLWITDLGSSNGTRVNDRRCEPERPTPLAPDDRLSLGAVEFLVLAGAEEAS